MRPSYQSSQQNALDDARSFSDRSRLDPKARLLKGAKFGDTRYKVHIDGNNLMPARPGQVWATNWRKSFEEFPPRRNPGSFNLSDAMDKVSAGEG
jgi:hypothetical protein